MANKSKAENAAALLSAGISRKSYSKAEFSARHGISVGLYDKLKSSGWDREKRTFWIASLSPTMPKPTGFASAKLPVPRLTRHISNSIHRRRPSQ